MTNAYTTADLDTRVVQRAYASWAPVYDAVCGPIFARGRLAAAEAARSVGGLILEVGVGTGLSFGHYDEETEIVGVDISPPMVAKARARMATGKFPHVADVRVMDAHDIGFPDASFDCVVSQFVITLVENPERVLNECARVTKPGGEIILVNHLYSEKGAAAAIERFAARHVGRFGLRPEFPFARLEAWAEAHGGVTLVERRLLKPARVYTLIRFRRRTV